MPIRGSWLGLILFKQNGKGGVLGLISPWEGLYRRIIAVKESCKGQQEAPLGAIQGRLGYEIMS